MISLNIVFSDNFFSSYISNHISLQQTNRWRKKIACDNFDSSGVCGVKKWLSEAAKPGVNRFVAEATATQTRQTNNHQLATCARSIFMFLLCAFCSFQWFFIEKPKWSGKSFFRLSAICLCRIVEMVCSICAAEGTWEHFSLIVRHENDWRSIEK